MVTDTATKIVYDFHRIVRCVDAEMHQRMPPLDTSRVGPLGCMTLQQLSRIEPAPVQQLVENMGRDPSQMSRVLRSLESKGLIERASDPNDGRVRILTLSEEGRSFAGTADDVLQQILQEMMHNLTAEEERQLLCLMQKMR